MAYSLLLRYLPCALVLFNLPTELKFASQFILLGLCQYQSYSHSVLVFYKLFDCALKAETLV
jgi:hypothetical protein